MNGMILWIGLVMLGADRPHADLEPLPPVHQLAVAQKPALKEPGLEEPANQKAVLDDPLLEEPVVEEVEKEDEKLFSTDRLMLHRIPPVAQKEVDRMGASTLDLNQVRCRTFAGSPDVAAAKARLERAIAEVVKTRSQFYPTISTEYDVTYFPDFGGGTGSQSEGPTRFEADASWVLFNGFRRKFELLASNLAWRSACHGVDESARILEEAMNQAYYSALLAQLTMEIAEQDVWFNESLADFVSRRRSAGMASKSEFLNFKIKAGNARRKYLTARREYGVLLAALGAIMNLCEPLDPEKVRLARPDSDSLPETEADWKSSFQFALKHRPDITQRVLAIRQGCAQADAARGDYWPEVSLESDYSVGSSEEPNLVSIADEAASVGVVIRWNVFEGFRRPAEVASQVARARELKEDYRRTVLDLIGQLKEIQQRVEWNKKLVANQEDTHKFANEDRNLVLRLYEADLVSITRLNEVQKDFTQSAERLANAEVRLALAHVDFQTAMGLLCPEARAAVLRVASRIKANQGILTELPRN